MLKTSIPNSFICVEKAIPLKQGLKQRLNSPYVSHQSGRKGNSIKTRIETQ